MMKPHKSIVNPIMAILIGLSMAIFTGCGNSETREQVDETVEELTGKKAIDRMQQIKSDINEIQNQQTQRLDEINSLADDQ